MTAVMEETEVKRESRRIAPPSRTPQEANAACRKKAREQEAEESRALEWAKSLELASVKFTSGKVNVIFQHGLEGFKAKTTAQSVGDVPSSFLDALNALAPHVAKLIFYNAAEVLWQTQKIEVKGINIRHFEEGNIHVGISFTLTLPNGRQLNACTPQMPMHSDNPEIATHEKEGGSQAVERFIAATQTLLSKVEKTGNLFAPLED